MKTLCVCVQLVFAVPCRRARAAAIEGLDKLTPAMQDDIVASSTSVGPLIEIISVRTSSAPGWPYELSFKCNCSALFDHHLVSSWPPPKFEQLSITQQQQFSLNTKIPIGDRYILEKFNHGAVNTWVAEDIISQVERGKSGSLECAGPYEDSHCLALEAYPARGNGVVIGSQSPWLESSILASGAAHITTIEYSETKCIGYGFCNQLRIIHPDVAASEYLSGKLGAFDFAFSFSSLEHSGLGRYGDPINPSGDLEAIQQVFCMLKPGGIFYFSVPTNLASDALIFNAHRIYGPLRLPLATANFEILGIYGNNLRNRTWSRAEIRRNPKSLEGGHPVIILRKPGGPLKSNFAMSVVNEGPFIPFAHRDQVNKKVEVLRKKQRDEVKALAIIIVMLAASNVVFGYLWCCVRRKSLRGTGGYIATVVENELAEVVGARSRGHSLSTRAD